MYKKEITYKDYNDETRTDVYYFNISRAEFIELQYSVPGGFLNHLRNVTSSNDEVKIMKIFKQLLELSCGIKSDDGITFHKSKEITNRFMESEAYSEFLMELTTKADAAAEYVNNVLPMNFINDTSFEAVKKAS